MYGAEMTGLEKFEAGKIQTAIASLKNKKIKEEKSFLFRQSPDNWLSVTCSWYHTWF